MKPRKTYHDLVRRDIFGLLPSHLGKVLDFGGGIGATAGALRTEHQAERAVLFDQVAQGADPAIDQAIALDLDDLAQVERELAKAAPFDTVLCLDILEHLRDPWQTVRLIDSAMAPGATLIISVPNIGHLSVLAPLLLRGRFDYADAGILDRTHLRWFTRDSAIALGSCSGLMLERIEANIFGRAQQWANRASLGLGQRFFTKQYKLALRKTGEHGQAA